MKQVLLLCCISAATFLAAKGQHSVYGKWYTFSRDGVTELVLHPDSLVINKLASYVSPAGIDRQMAAYRIQRIVEANGLVYLELKDPEDVADVKMIHGVRLSASGQELELLVPENYELADTFATGQFIKGDTGYRYGMLFITRTELIRLNGQRSIDTMKAVDFKSYVDRFVAFGKDLDRMSPHDAPWNYRIYRTYFMLRHLFGQLGYNPLFTDEQLDRLVKRYKGDPDTKAWAEQLDH